MRPGAKRSTVWIHFEKNSAKRVLCKLCMKEFNFCGNTTNMRVHLRKKHPDAFDCKEEVQQDLHTSPSIKEFTTDSDEKLIYLVRENDCLYNLSNKDYSNFLVKESIWRNIASELDCHADDCKSRWTTLRNYYRRALKRTKSENGQIMKKPKWIYAEQMQFLKQHMSEREDCPNGEVNDNYDDSQLETPEFYEENVPYYTQPVPPTLENVISYVRSKHQETEQDCETSLNKRNLMRFFDDIAETMCTFSEVDQAEMKGNIFNMVNSKHLQLLKEKEENKMSS